MSNRTKKIISDFVIFTIGSFGSKILYILLLPLYTSILSTSEYGSIDLITTTATLLFPIVTLGLNDAIFRFVMGNSYANDDVIRIGIKIQCIMYLISFCLLWILNIFIKWEHMWGMLMLLLTHMIYELALNYTKAIGKSKTYALIGIFQTVLLLVLNIVLLKEFALGIRGYLLSYCLSYFIPGTVLIIKLRIVNESFAKKQNIEDISLRNEMLKYSIPLIFNSISWMIIMSSDRYMIRWMIGIDSVGIYSVATKIPIILQTIITIFMTVWEMSSNDVFENENDHLAKFYEKGMKYYSAIGYCSGSFLLLICPYLMRILAKGAFYEGWVYAPFLIVSVVFATSGGMNGAIYAAFKDNRGALISTLYGAMINLVLNYFGIRYFGIVGATISTAISRLFISVYRTKDTERFLAFKRSYLKVIICSVLIVLQAILLTQTDKYRLIIQVVLFVVMLGANYKSISDAVLLVYYQLIGSKL